MQHLNPYRFYELAAKLHALFDATAQGRASALFAPMTEAQHVLDTWIKGNAYLIETSKTEASKLLAKIASLFNKYYIDQSTRQLRSQTGEETVDAHEMALLRNLLEKFEHALAAELTHAPTYSAAKRGIYSTYDLIENAHHCFSEGLRAVMPEAALTELNAAGRALAFGLGTGAAMHLLRAVEMVLKRYYEAYSGTNVAKSERSYSIYLKKLAALAEDETSGNAPDKRLLQMLAQIKENYRNPLTTPELVVSIDQATSLFALATAVMTLMGEQIAARQNLVPAAPATAPAPAPAKKALEALGKDAASEPATEGDSYDFRSSKAS